MKTLPFLAAAALASAPAHAEQGPVATVQANLDAYRARNLDAFVRTFADDAVVEFMGVRVEGRAQIREVYRLNFAPSAPDIELIDSGQDGNTVWMQYRMIFADGSEVCCAQSDFTVTGGKITYLVAHRPQ